jgi:hypothetical protein
MKVIGGVSDANSAFTDDGQVGIGFLPGAFDATAKTTISIDIKPVANFPAATSLHFATNVYLITADAPLVKGANLVLRYSDLVPAPSFVYLAPDATSQWASIGGAEGQPFTIQVTTNKLGYFAAGYPEGATTKPSGTSQLLPIAVALLIVGVLLAGIPLAMVRRRRAAGGEGEDDEDDAEGEDGS